MLKTENGIAVSHDADGQYRAFQLVAAIFDPDKNPLIRDDDTVDTACALACTALCLGTQTMVQIFAPAFVKTAFEAKEQGKTGAQWRREWFKNTQENLAAFEAPPGARILVFPWPEEYRTEEDRKRLAEEAAKASTGARS